MKNICGGKWVKNHVLKKGTFNSKKNRSQEDKSFQLIDVVL